MMRYATLADYDFIFSHVLKEAQNGHFSRDLLKPAATRGLELELKSVLSRQTRVNGFVAYALIWEKMGQRIGFMAMSALDGDRDNELWLAAISPQHRGCGEGRKMINTVLSQFKGRNSLLTARCAPESEAMFHILTSSGFHHDATMEKGTRGLVYTL